MPAIWRNVDRFHAAGAIAVTAFGLVASTASADDGSLGPPNFMMTWDVTGDTVDALTYDPAIYGTVEWGTWTLPGGTGMDPGAESHDRTGWRYQGGLSGISDAWTLTWDCVANADPFVDATINVTNNSLTTQTFWIYMPLAITPPITTITSMAGSVSAVVTDANFDGGGLLATTPTDSVFQGFIDTLPVANARMWNPESGYSLAAPAFGANSDTESFNNQTGPPALTQIAVQLRFTLSPGDSASVTGTFDVMPIPGPGGLSLLAFSLLACGRRRRH
jgi:hypothetical protein